MRKKLIISSLIALFFFLPFSSWLVSLTGSSLVSLIRDFLILIIFLLSLPDFFVACHACENSHPVSNQTDSGSQATVRNDNRGRKIRLSTFQIFCIIFIAWGLLTFFWREASTMQWLKGFRFTFLPVILALSLTNIKLQVKEKKLVVNSVLISSLLILILTSVEALGVRLPLTSALSDEGALISTHYVGNSSLIRLQSVLAGPNALGLYLLGLCCFALGLFRQIDKKLGLLFIPYAIFLVLTFSRSAIIGLIFVVLTGAFLYLQKRFGNFKTVLLTVTFALALGLAGIFVYQKIGDKNLFTHNDSSSLRVEQYERIWDSRSEIGLLGRGSGTAGPSSQARLDNGENHWTENIYLDIFEELGLVGLILYLALLATALFGGIKISDELARKTAILALVSFAISGIFINYYTGQAGIFLMWLAVSLNKSKES